MLSPDARGFRRRSRRLLIASGLAVLALLPLVQAAPAAARALIVPHPLVEFGGPSVVHRASVTGSITPGGSSVSVTISTPGDNAMLSFSGNSGQRVSARATNVSMTGYQYGCCAAQLKVLNPDGSTLSGLGGSYAWVDASSGGFLDTMTLPTSGTYTLQLQPQNNATGSVTLTLYDVPADPAPVVVPASGTGTSVTLSTTTPGQNIAPTFSGTAGQRVSVKVSSPTITGYQYSCCAAQFKVLKPDGSTLSGLGGSYAWVDASSGGFLDTVTLPTSGTYTVFVDPQIIATGGATITVYDVPADPAPVVVPASGVGTSVTLSTTTPGQNIGPTFSGTAGQRVSVKVSSPTITGYQYSCCAAQLKILKWDGSTVSGLGGSYAWVDASSGGFLDTVTLPATGTYTVFVDPQIIATGGATITVYDVPADATGVIATDGTPFTISLLTPGQNGRFTFTGTTDGFDVELTDVSIGSSTCCGLRLSVLKPDGTTLVSPTFFGTDGGSLDLGVLPVAGTYTVVVDPLADNAGTASISVYDPPKTVTAYYLMDCDTTSLYSHAYNIGQAFAQNHPGDTRLLILDFGGARVISDGVYGVKGFCRVNGVFVRFTNAEILTALKKAADACITGTRGEAR